MTYQNKASKPVGLWTSDVCRLDLLLRPNFLGVFCQRARATPFDLIIVLTITLCQNLSGLHQGSTLDQTSLRIQLLLACPFLMEVIMLMNTGCVANSRSWKGSYTYWHRYQADIESPALGRL